jgi:hypothetical protein
LLFVFWPSYLCAQEAATNHKVILRRDPTTSSPALEHLSKGTRLTLVDALPDSGFYHAKTEDDRVGWVFAKYVSISTAETPATPTSPSTSPSIECDSSISAHVYHPKRLIVKQECIAVTGTIVDATATHPNIKQMEPDTNMMGILPTDILKVAGIAGIKKANSPLAVYKL